MESTSIAQRSIQDVFNKYFPYLMEIRKRLLFLMSVFLVSSFVGFFYYDKIIAFILKTLDLKGVNIAFTSPFQYFTLSINSAFLVGLVVVFPLVVYQFILFLKPALKEKEFKLVAVLIPLSLILFAIGFGFGFAIMKYVVTIFYLKSVELNIGNLLDISLLLSKIILTGILMGFAFQFPIVMTALMRLKIVKYRVFVKQRFLAYMVALLFAALLPPTDLLSLLFLTLPLVMLFEITLILNRFILGERR